MTISFHPLQTNPTEWQLEEISGLIYDTDPYIYPAMFASREEAVRVIPKMIQADDVMFCRENLFVAESGGHIVGIILWHEGPMNWNSEIYKNCGGDSAYIDEVEKRYFAAYQDIPPSCVSLINICISRDVRGQGIGGKMMDAFFQVKQGPFELFVLADNPAAVKLYQAKGFQITQQQGGFSLDGIAPLCYRMVKE